MSNQSERELKEMKNLFEDPKFCRKAWKGIGLAILQNPATKTPAIYDKEGNMTLQSEIENYSYNKLCEDIKRLGDQDRAPTELEMIMQCQAVRARFDTQAAIFVRDTVGAKPVDESKVDATVGNQYEQLSDEELQLLLDYREKKSLKEGTDAGHN